MLAMDVARDDQDLLVVTENGYGKRTLDRRVPQDLARRQGRQDDPADRGQGRARRRARRARAPGARLHLPERHGAADRACAASTARPRRAGRPGHEPARGRRRLRGRAGRRVRGRRPPSPTTARSRSTPPARPTRPAATATASIAGDPADEELLDVPEVEPRRRCRTPTVEASSAPRTRPRAAGPTVEWPSITGLLDVLGRRQLVLDRLERTSSGTDGGGATVWIPLTSGSSTRLVLAAGHLQGPVRTVAQLRTTPLSLVETAESADAGRRARAAARRPSRRRR